MSTLKPLTLWGKGGINPSKIAILLEELHIPYDVNPYPMSKVKDPEYLALNPNGRLPTIVDPNTDLTLWESGAITEYLIEQYDKDHTLSFASNTTESWHAKQWLYFQVSGQGPYYGQASWFKKFHPEQVPSALTRYVDEMKRVTGVLEGHLAKQSKDNDGPWLVGNKLSFADLSFLTWQKIITWVVTKEDGFNPAEFPLVAEWMEKMLARDSVRIVMGELKPAA
ncbi:glutathione S-transferase [Pseudovirgaria hyperparasitica]|uniref:Glutathione S-transferase n=1 Tax=Pseudovirgaria hyperparasitica TaxID=470096 RepID=A0A6A6WBV6_9PEZI|nr:glutathione S-transferase [Pseudovirgaria hyperparasitica]KAF2759087.1 glutathione S-transferase [Pseudovirgaria hyperparasitica]